MMNGIYLIVGLLIGQAVSQKLMAICNIEAASGKTDYPLEGTVTFMQEPGQNVTIDIDFRGFNTTDEHTKHGFHVHQYAQMSDFCKDAGGHFNPEGVEHGGPQDLVRHVGDLGNIVEEMDGTIIYSFTDHIIQLEGNYSIIGKSIVVHEREDDLGTGGESDSKTTGHAGPRLGCCVIEAVMYVDQSSGMTSSGTTESGSGATTMVQVNDDESHAVTVCSASLALMLVCSGLLELLV